MFQPVLSKNITGKAAIDNRVPVRLIRRGLRFVVKSTPKNPAWGLTNFVSPFYKDASSSRDVLKRVFA